MPSDVIFGATEPLLSYAAHVKTEAIEPPLSSITQCLVASSNRDPCQDIGYWNCSAYWCGYIYDTSWTCLDLGNLVMSPILGYWKIKGLVQPTRLLLEYLEEKYEEHLYERDEGDKWRNKKFELGLEFPNLPYYIDGDVKLTQSMAIIRYIADKHNMLGGCPKERAEISMLEGAVLDIRYGVSRIAYSKDFETLKVDFLSKLPEMLKMFEDRLCHKTYLNGDHVTHPDFMLYDALDVVLYMDPMCLDAFPKLVCFKKRIEVSS
ncbi:Glutathione S-transferase class-mu 26 kDa isozyme isoform 1 [Schistosoma japonicum]|uniref:Glutathione S-transferase class-mu 26 kDa isozyme n=1 Tax=Schistosoma japonicum TaxID=6182 RepID=A0A4Z2DAE1_SCHJA|nr:Glutathione S-transferase class-mu 26 kDa isozyme isoform 1 [Schistosoma japonicum]